MRFKIIIGLISLMFFYSCQTEEDLDLKETYPKGKSCIDDKNWGKEKGEVINLKSGAEVKKYEDKYVYLDDIILSEEQLKLLEETGSIFPEDLTEENEPYFIDSGKPISPIFGTATVPNTSVGGSKAVGRNPYQGMFWAMVRYTYSDNLSSYQKNRIADAIKYVESQTNARFYNATGKPTRDPQWGFDYPYIEFVPSEYNRSFVGRKGGKQILEIANFWSRGIIVHEICHALGMFHEQSRADRDQYINVLYNNIIPDERPNFRKETRNYYIIDPFDFNSIMLYGSFDFAIGSNPTITKKNGDTFVKNRSGLSESDRKFINTFYLPYKAREDVCVELDSVVYDRYNNRLSEEDRIYLEEQLNRNRCFYPLR